MVSVRAATQHDAEAISHVHVQSWRTTYTGLVPEAYLSGLDEAERALRWREWLTLDVKVFVASLDDELVGFISGGAIREPLRNYDAELFAIYVLKQAQGQGAGTALLQVLATTLHAGGFKNMVAWVLRSNASIRFYQNSGASPVESKEVEIGGVTLPVLAYGWPDLKAIAG